MRTIKYLVIHCTAGDYHETISQLVNYFLKVMKWSRVGYHVVITYDGVKNKLIDYQKISNGVEPFQNNTINISNSNSINISYTGGLKEVNDKIYVDPKGNWVSEDTRSPEQLKSMEELIKEILEEFPDIKILGHNQVSPKKKTCPSFNAVDYLRSIGIPERNIYTGDNFGMLKWMNIKGLK